MTRDRRPNVPTRPDAAPADAAPAAAAARRAGVALLAAAAALLAVGPARAAPVLVFEPADPGQATVPAGANVAINVVLRGARTAVVNTLQFDVSAPTNGAAIGASATAADRFDESAILARLDMVIDGSLTNNRTLAFGRDNGTGIPAGSADVRVGTFFLQTPAGVAGTFAVGPLAIELTDPDFALVATTGQGTTIRAVVPEPASAAAAAAAAAGLFGARRRRRRR